MKTKTLLPSETVQQFFATWVPPGLVRHLPDRLPWLGPIRPDEQERIRQSVQERLFDMRVEDGILWLSTGHAVKLLEISPINIRLKSPFERKNILRAYTEVMNSLRYPVQVLNHAEPLNLTVYIASIQSLLEQEQHPVRRAVLGSYAAFVEHLTHNRNLVRRRFLKIIPYTGYTSKPTVSEIRGTLEGRAGDLKSLLERAGLLVHEIADVEIANVIHASLRPALAIDQQILPEDLQTSRFVDLVAPDYLEFPVETPGYYRIGDLYARVLLVTAYKPEVREGWLSDLYRYHPQVSISQHKHPTAADELQKEISNSLGEIRHQLSKGNLSALEVKHAEIKEKSGDYLLTQLASGAEQVLDFSMYVQVTAPTVHELDDLSRKVEALMGAKGMKTRRPSHRSQEAFDCMLPWAINALKATTAYPMPTSAAASTFPYDNAELSHDSGILRGVNKYTKNVVIIDPYKLVGPHEIALATTGAGKSVEMHVSLDREWAQGSRLFILDKEREYQHHTRARGGQWINLAPGAGNIINILEVRPAPLPPDHNPADEEPQDGMAAPPAESANPLFAAIQRQQAILSYMLPDITDVELAYLEEAQLECYLKDAQIHHTTDFESVPRDAWPHIGHLAERLKSNPQCERLQKVLQRYVTGSLQGIFNGATSIDLDASWVCLDLFELEDLPQAQKPITVAALAYCWDEMRRDRTKRKTLAVDELGLFTDGQSGNDYALWFLWMISKRGRKYGIRLKSATQQVADVLAAGRYAQALIGNAETKILGRQKETDLADLRKLIPFSDEEVSLLANMSREDKLLMVGTQRALITVEVSQEEAGTISKAFGEEMRRRGAK